MFKLIKAYIKNIQKNSILTSTAISLLFTMLTLFVFNFEPHENALVSNALFKNIMLGVVLFIAFFVLVQTDYIIASYKRAIADRDKYIDELEGLIVRRELDNKK